MVLLKATTFCRSSVIVAGRRRYRSCRFQSVEFEWLAGSAEASSEWQEVQFAFHRIDNPPQRSIANPTGV